MQCQSLPNPKKRERFSLHSKHPNPHSVMPLTSLSSLKSACLFLSEQKQMTSFTDRVSPGFTSLGSIGPADTRMTVVQYFLNIKFSLSVVSDVSDVRVNLLTGLPIVLSNLAHSVTLKLYAWCNTNGCILIHTACVLNSMQDNIKFGGGNTQDISFFWPQSISSMLCSKLLLHRTLNSPTSTWK